MGQSITLQFLGTGTIAPDPQRSCSCVLIEAAQRKILVDVGAGSLRRLAELEINPHEIEYIFLTHFHPDHVGDLVPFIFSLRNTRENASGEGILRVWGPSGLYRFVQGMQRGYGRWMQHAAEEVRFYELKRPSLEFSGFRVHWRRVMHNQESVGYRFEFPDGNIAFSGDSGYCSDLIELCRSVNLAVLECSHADENAVKGHLSPSLAGQIARRAGVKKLVLTHFYPDALQSDPRLVTQKYFDGEIIVAEDGKKVNISAS